MKKWIYFPALLFVVLFLGSCQKELSREGDGLLATGSLQESGGDCLPKKVNGIYEATTALTDSNYIEVSVIIGSPGEYRIYTDTLNGFYFSSSGRFNSPGLATIRLTGTGTPLAPGTDNFNVYFDTTVCSVSVVTFAAGAGGAAEYSLECGDYQFSGTYQQGVSLDVSNQLGVGIIATLEGVYDISGSVNGISFSAVGSVTETGVVTQVILQGTGTPVQAGTFQLQLTGANGSNAGCTVEISFDAGVAVDWSFTAGGNISYSGSVEFAAIEPYDFGAPIGVRTIFMYDGVRSPDQILLITLIDGDNTPFAVGEVYRTNSFTGNSAFFEFLDDNLTYTADPTSPAAANITYTIQEHDVQNRRIRGIFSGTAIDEQSAIINITNGNFSAIYE